MKPKIIRMTTVPISMNIILKGQLGYINQFYEMVGVTGQDDKHFPAIAEREGIRMVGVEMARTISLKKDVQALLRLIQLFRQERPTVVHTHTPKAGLLGMLAAWWTMVPVRLHTLGGTPLVGARGIKGVILFLTEWITYRLANRVYPNSKGLAELLIDMKVLRQDKVRVLGKGSSNGVNIEKFSSASVQKDQTQLKADFGFNQADFVFLFVGRLAREKGIHELLEAFVSVRQHCQDAKLAFVGTFEKDNGALSDRVKELIDKNQDIFFLGRFDDVSPLYKMADVFVLPSYREGFPNALLEACSMGLPCIATDINGCNEVITSGQTGLLIPPQQTSPLEVAMRQLYENASLRQQLGTNARKQVEQFFRSQFLWECWKQEYDYWIQRTPSRVPNP